MFPVYRTSEGAENININYETFTVCRQLFKQNGIVLVFSEGLCINEWHLRPLMKGTARLAFSSWDENIPLEILPVGINYSSFRRFGKNLFINFGEIISKKDFDLAEADGKKFQAFNQKLQEQLQQLVFEIDKKDLLKQKRLLEKKSSLISKILLFIPGLFGWLIHAPLFLPIKNYVIRRTRNNDHFDSIVVALLLFFYPWYLLILTAITILLTQNLYFLLLLLILPFTAWAYVQVKSQLDIKKS